MMFRHAPNIMHTDGTKKHQVSVFAPVSPDACGRGIGKQLMEWAESAALPLLRTHHPSLEGCKLCLWVCYLAQLFHWKIMPYVLVASMVPSAPHVLCAGTRHTLLRP